MAEYRFSSSATFPNNVPNIVELAKTYKAAIAVSDLRLAQVAEASALHVAVAEAGIAEAAVMRDFIREAGLG